jgi:hypothetical protein
MLLALPPNQNGYLIATCFSLLLPLLSSLLSALAAADILSEAGAAVVVLSELISRALLE